ncbi:hypothetical protein PISMIDRAFT_670484 [Pisolithus microcarpus 441]|uniref:Uncharacterized protein n=1 Tax=Pisolithus microcarpus 441 TaxID=765257 RepID=A0A0C9ZLV6_9AGAM|nr:hypothetical protein PISMIDRAFT_670484 [Pisolithus microcarpus 441]
MDGSKSNAANGSFEVSTSNGSTSRIFRIRGSVLSSATAPSSSQVSLAASGRAADAGNVSPSMSTGSRQPSTSANCLNQSALAQNSLVSGSFHFLSYPPPTHTSHQLRLILLASLT